MFYYETSSLTATLPDDGTTLDGYRHIDCGLPSPSSVAIAYNRPPTPPPDMHGSTSSIRNGYSYDSAIAPYAATSQPYSHTFSELQERDRLGTSSQPLSPSTYGRSSTQHETISEPSVSRRSSQTSLIAPSFQIPKTVNDSGGSLSELAAQITCLFWFESSDLLQQIEQSPHSILPARPLVKDAVPTIGFRKWVTTILSTTLVGANVVLLALLFIHRLKNLNRAVKGKPGSEYRLLTVALMLGNKFLDDNTYTNKTWAEVSGINVSEVHVMEVEFLSNMKYCLYTSMEQWADWQTLLGRYAVYVERAMNPILARAAVPAPILPPASTIRMPIALPSPPSSIQASPPYNLDRSGMVYSAAGINPPLGLTPAPSPLTPYTNSQDVNSRKRSRDDSVVEPPAKRQAPAISHSLDQYLQAQRNLHTLPPPLSQTIAGQGQQLPPISVPQRAMGLVYPSTSQSTPAALSAVPDLRSTAQSQPASRQKSPFWRPADDMSRLPPSSNLLHPLDLSPSTYLQQRGSPYRPVHNVSTLLYPPPSATMQSRAQNMEYSQMHYQPLGKASQLHTGRLPVITPNNWLDALKPWTLPAVAQSTRPPPSSLRS